MTKGVVNSVYRLFFARNDEKRVVIARVRRTRGNLSMATTAHNPSLSLESQHLHIVIAIIEPSLRGFEKAVVIHKKLKIEN